MLVVISYDIESDRTRTKLANKLKDYGPRVQKSVFEADVGAEEYKKMLTMLKEVNIEGDDTIRVYKICSVCVKQIKLIGKGEITEDRQFHIA
jgi:CRISPR-associated protein Cas2